MTARTRFLGVFSSFCACAAARAAVIGQVLYEDVAGNTHPSRGIRVELYDLGVLIGTTSADLDGNYSFAASPNPNTADLKFIARHNGGYVTSDGTLTGAWSAGVPLFAAPGGYTIPNTHTGFRAFMVADALYTSYYFANQQRPVATAAVALQYPDSGSFFTPADQRIHLLDDDRGDWDVINHEYGHYLSHLDTLDQSPGGSHSFGVSNIPGLGKQSGVRLAWGEALGTYIGLASQNVDKAGQNLPNNIAVAGDQNYTDTIDSTLDVGIEAISGAVNAGEGDEASVARILWDLGDNPVGDDDPITIGLGNLYQTMRGIGGLDQLDDVWDHYFAISGDASRAQFGEIFETHAVSPHPTGGVIGGVFDDTSPPLTFTWERRNNNANDTFQLLIFDATMMNRILDIAVAGDVTDYTLSQAEWDTLLAMPQLFSFVVAGSDTDGFATGPYWSGAYQFTVIPGPGVTGLLVSLGLVGMTKRRRDRGSKW